MSLELNPTLKSSKIRVGITMGDPSGIGPEITASALKRLSGLADFLVIGDKGVLAHFLPAVSSLSRVNLLDLKNVSPKNFHFGRVKAEYGKASIEYLDAAIKLLKQKEIDCLVTCPISKEAVNLGGLPGFSGHTEYLALAVGAKDYVMMLLNKRLRISLVTRHLPLSRVPAGLNSDVLSKTILITYHSLQKMFAIPSPRIVVCGLNPHASDNGVLGNEENKIIKPVIEGLKNRIKHLSGPESADVAIGEAYQKDYDCVIAMYHDQALIPLKLSGNDSGVNITLGLPFVRTSPLHGTAFDIAGTASASPSSLIAAIKLAIKCTLNLKNA